MPRTVDNLLGREGNKATMLAVMLAGIVSLLALIAFVSPAQAKLAATGPVDPATNFPAWYEDTNGLRLGLCIDSPNCSATTADLVAPDGEAFWFSSGADMTTSAGKALLVMATEAAYNGTGPDQESAFDRIRIRINVSQAGTYVVTYPYGQKTYDVAAGDIGPAFEINDTTDFGCFSTPGVNTCNDGIPADFDTAALGTIGPFLTWDPAFGQLPPAGFIGDGATPHRVIGSPNDTNFFRIEGPNVGGPGVNSVQTNLFTVEGKIMGASPTALSLAARPAALSPGQSTKLSGKLASFGQPLAGKQVTLIQKPQGATAFSPVPGGTLTTGAKGGFSLTGVAPTKNTVYRAKFAGEVDVYKASTSASMKVTVTR